MIFEHGRFITRARNFAPTQGVTSMKRNDVTFPHVKGLAKKRTKFGHRWILTEPDSTGKSRSITVKILDTDSVDVFYRKISEARDVLHSGRRDKTFNSWVDEYIKLRQLRKNSIKSLKQSISNMSFDEAENDRQIKKLISSERKKSTIKLKIEAINTFFRWLIDNGVKIKNPAANVFIKSQNIPRTRTLTESEYAELIKYADTKETSFRLFIRLLIFTGARISTVCELKPNNLDADNNLTLYNVKIGKPYDYKLKLTDETSIRLWREIQAEKKDSLWGIDGDKYGHRLTVYMEQKFGKDNNGERLSAHSLRHSFASNAAKQGVPIEIISKLLDHQSIATTSKFYARFSQNQIDEAVDKAINFIGKSTKT